MNAYSARVYEALRAEFPELGHDQARRAAEKLQAGNEAWHDEAACAVTRGHDYVMVCTGHGEQSRCRHCGKPEAP